MGRIKLGANVLGASKKAITDSVKYANERKQFNTFISSFGAIQYKLAQQVIRTWGLDSAIYRLSKDIDDQINRNKESGMDKGRASIEGFRSTVEWVIPQKWQLKEAIVIQGLTESLKAPMKSTVCLFPIRL